MSRLSAEETVLVAQIFAQADLQSSSPSSKASHDTLTVAQLSQIFSASQIAPNDLETIFSIVDPHSRGYFTRKQVGKIVRLVGWVQEGAELTFGLVNRCGPLAVIAGLPLLRGTRNRRTKTLKTVTNDEDDEDPEYPPLGSAAQARYVAIFQKAKPVDGILSSLKVWHAFRCSGLPTPTIARLWALIDTEKTGDLNLDEFVLGMYFIEGLLNNKFSKLPNEIPSFLLDQVQNPVPLIVGPLPPSSPNTRPTRKKTRWAVPSALKKSAEVLFTTLDEARISRDVFDSYMQRSRLSQGDLVTIWELSDIGNNDYLTTNEFALALFLMHRKLAGIPFPNVLPSTFLPPGASSSATSRDHPDTSTAPDWSIPEPVQDNAMQIFQELDINQRGYIEKDVSVPFMTDSQLSVEDLTRVWDLVDLHGRGRLNRDDLAVMLYVIHRRLGGLKLPRTLPSSLWPDSKPMLPLMPSSPVVKTQDELLKSWGLNFDNDDDPVQSPPVVQSPPFFTSPPLSPVRSPLLVVESEDERDLRSEIGQLRIMIENLRLENVSLRESVHDIRRQSRWYDDTLVERGRSEMAGLFRPSLVRSSSSISRVRGPREMPARIRPRATTVSSSVAEENEPFPPAYEHIVT